MVRLQAREICEPYLKWHRGVNGEIDQMIWLSIKLLKMAQLIGTEQGIPNDWRGQSNQD